MFNFHNFETALRAHAYPLCQSKLACCHCEEHSDVAISLRLNTRRQTTIATATGLPRYARNDKAGTRERY